MRRMMLTMAVLCALTLTGAAQQPLPRFDVASVKRNMSGDPQIRLSVPPTGSITIINAPLDMIIREAYQLKSEEARHRLIVPRESAVLGWEMRFDIQAKPPDNVPPGQQHEMLRALLAERFKLRIHRETQPTPIYALTVVQQGELGPALRPSKCDCAALHSDLSRRFQEFAAARGADGRPLCGEEREGSIPGESVIRSAGEISALANSLNVVMDRPVLDETQLSGSYEWTLAFATSQSAIEAGSTRIGTAIQEQLGLKLERKTVPYEVLVIDSVEMPTPN